MSTHRLSAWVINPSCVARRKRKSGYQPRLNGYCTVVTVFSSWSPTLHFLADRLKLHISASPMAPRAWPHLGRYRHVDRCPAIHFQVTHRSLNSLQNTLLKPCPTRVCATASHTIRGCSRHAGRDARSVVTALCCSCCKPKSARDRCCRSVLPAAEPRCTTRSRRLTVLMDSITEESIRASCATATAAVMSRALDPVVAA